MMNFLHSLFAPAPAPVHVRQASSRPVAPRAGPVFTTSIRCPDINALVVFGSIAQVVSRFVPLTDGAFAAAVRSLPSRVGGTTDLAGGIGAAVRLFDSLPGGIRRKIVVLTDGHATCGDPLVRDAARRAARGRVNIDTIGIGKASDYNGPLLREISGLTHAGRFSHCGNVAALNRAFGYGRTRSVSHIGQACAFVVDVSGSMSANFGRQTRIEAVRDAIERLVRVKQKQWN